MSPFSWQLYFLGWPKLVISKNCKRRERSCNVLFSLLSCYYGLWKLCLNLRNSGSHSPWSMWCNNGWEGFGFGRCLLSVVAIVHLGVVIVVSWGGGVLFGNQVRRDCRTVAATPPSASLRTTSLVTPSGRRIWEAQATGRKRSLGRQVGRKQWPVGLKMLQIRFKEFCNSIL